MRSSSIVSAATALLFSAPLALAAALVGRDPAPVRLRPNVVSHYKRFTYYSAAAYCSPDVLSQWTCGGENCRRRRSPSTHGSPCIADCEDLPNFTPFAAGGDGNAIQNCASRRRLVASSPDLIRARQGMSDTMRHSRASLSVTRGQTLPNCVLIS